MLNDEYQVRLERLKRIQEKYNPYPARVERSHTIAMALERFDALVGTTVSLCGRVRLVREHGGSLFFDIYDESGKIQGYGKSDHTEDFDFFKSNLDMGDFVEVKGEPYVTKRGEKSILVKTARIISKSLLPLPEKFHGLEDVETRYRQRYLDLLSNEDVKRKFVIRAKTITATREFLDNHGFIEVETPVLQPIPGGTSARPFITHHNALDLDMYLRIAPELYLKRLIVGGFEKVYEIGRIFRNEGMDREHNPEFTMLEFYWAYADYEELMKFTEQMLAHIIRSAIGKLQFEYQGKALDFSGSIKRVAFIEALKEYGGLDLTQFDDTEKLIQEVKARGVDVDSSWGRAKVIDEAYKELARKKMIGPVFLYDYPLELQALAKKKESNPRLVEQFQLIVNGFELIKAYSELNDPLDQLERFEEQEKLREAGDDEAQHIDHDYITALKHGMPPTAGFGMGIDRLVTLLTDSQTLKEIILFPTMRPESK